MSMYARVHIQSTSRMCFTGFSHLYLYLYLPLLRSSSSSFFFVVLFFFSFSYFTQLFVTARIIGRKCNRDEQASVITVIILEKISIFVPLKSYFSISFSFFFFFSTYILVSFLLVRVFRLLVPYIRINSTSFLPNPRSIIRSCSLFSPSIAQFLRSKKVYP